jgi:protein SCO1/2
MNRKYLVWGIGVVALIVLVSIFIKLTQKVTYYGGVIQPSLLAPDIELTTQNGSAFKLSEETDKYNLIFFGYTNCPDECPATLAKLKQAFALLGEDANQFQVVMVTTDPARDTASALRSFLSKFDPNFIGLLGSPEALQSVYANYGVYVEQGGEVHSNRVYLIDRKGNMRLTFPIEIQPSEIASDLKNLLKEK